NTTLNGQTDLSGGVLGLAGNLTHQGGCGHTLNATGDHAMLFNGVTTGTDTLKIAYTFDNECSSQLANVEVATTGDAGLTFATTTSLSIGNLHVDPAAKLRVPPAMILTVGGLVGHGVYIASGGTLTNDG